MNTTIESWPIGFRLDGAAPRRMLTQPRRWRAGPYVVEETVYRELWLLGSDDLRKLDRLPRAMSDHDVANLRIAGISTVEALVAACRGTIPMLRAMGGTR